MSKPVIFTISAAWDVEASMWSGHCDDIPAAADAATLDEVLAKISAMALDLLPDITPTAILRPCSCKSPPCAKLTWPRPEWRPSLTGPCAICRASRVYPDPARQGQPRNLASPITQQNFAVPVGIPSRHTANAILPQTGLPKAF